MSAETLRRAAAQLREDWDNDDDRRTFPKAAAYNLAVADLLDALALDREMDPYIIKGFDHAAVEVARAYLGEAS